MSTRDDKKPKPPAPTLKSDGEEAAQGYVEADLPEQPRSPTMEMERVHFTDPRRAPTMRREDMLKQDAARKARTPRAPEQMALKPTEPARVAAPDARPATKMQALHFDEDLLKEMREKLASGGAAGADAEAANNAEPTPQGAGAEGDEEKSGPKPASPWSKDAGADAPIRKSALPSSLRPRTSQVPAGQKTAPATTGARRGPARAVALAIVVLAVALVLRAAFTSAPAPAPENGSASQGPAPKTTLTAAAPTAPPPAALTAAPTPSAEPKTAPPATAPTAAPAPPATSPAPERHTAPKASGALEDPYSDAAVKPLPAATAQPVAPAPSVAPLPAPQPTAQPKATTTAPRGPAGGDRGFGD